MRENCGYAKSLSGSVPVCKGKAILIRKVTRADHDEIHKGADAKAACREQPEKSCSDFADVEPVHAEPTDENAEQQRDQPVVQGDTGAESGVMRSLSGCLRSAGRN